MPWNLETIEWRPIISSLGVGGAFGGIFGNWIGRSSERRKIRSGVLSAIAKVEDRRWSENPDGEDYPALRTAIYKLEAAAVVARIPRRALAHYVVLASAAHSLSAENWYPELGGTLDQYFGATIQDAAEVLVALVWHPWRGRLALRLRLGILRRRIYQIVHDDPKMIRALAGAQKSHRPLPGQLGRLPGVEDPPLYVRPTGRLKRWRTDAKEWWSEALTAARKQKQLEATKQDA